MIRVAFSTWTVRPKSNNTITKSIASRLFEHGGIILVDSEAIGEIFIGQGGVSGLGTRTADPFVLDNRAVSRHNETAHFGLLVFSLDYTAS